MISGNNGNRVREAPISRGRIYAYVMPTARSSDLQQADQAEADEAKDDKRSGDRGCDADTGAGDDPVYPRPIRAPPSIRW